jgi:hypothetical protein
MAFPTKLDESKLLRTKGRAQNDFERILVSLWIVMFRLLFLLCLIVITYINLL